jgi:hypothetical protein
MRITAAISDIFLTWNPRVLTFTPGFALDDDIDEDEDDDDESDFDDEDDEDAGEEDDEDEPETWQVAPDSEIPLNYGGA